MTVEVEAAVVATGNAVVPIKSGQPAISSATITENSKSTKFRRNSQVHNGSKLLCKECNPQAESELRRIRNKEFGKRRN
jgi:hypothetical protein